MVSLFGGKGMYVPKHTVCVRLSDGRISREKAKRLLEEGCLDTTSYGEEVQKGAILFSDSVLTCFQSGQETIIIRTPK